jgi:dUTP pyrophosphatase
METPTIKCTAVRPSASLPRRMTPGASGFDLMASLDAPVRLSPGSWALIPTGLVMEIPFGCEGAVRARSGLAFRHGIGVLNGPGTIDSDYRGEVGVLLMNWGREDFEVRGGDRIAQIVFQTVPSVAVSWATVDGSTQRGAGGFGHTGGFGHAGGSGPTGGSGHAGGFGAREASDLSGSPAGDPGSGETPNERNAKKEAPR